MKEKNILGGIALIIVAAILVANGMGVLPDIPWFGLICSVFLGAYAIKGLWKREFFGAMMALAFVAWIWNEYLLIENITPFPLLLAAALLGIGLNMLVGKKKSYVSFHKGVESEWEYYNPSDDKENWTEGRHIRMENSFNSVSKYVNSDAFSTASLENNFGSANIYFNNAVIADGQANIELENNFGEMNIYLPKTWRMRLSQESAFGNVRVYGSPNNDMDAPLVIIKAESNFGNLKIYFE